MSKKKNNNKIKRYLEKFDLLISLLMLFLGLFMANRLIYEPSHYDLFDPYIFISFLYVVSLFYYGLSYFIKKIKKPTIRIIALIINIVITLFIFYIYYAISTSGTFW